MSKHLQPAESPIHESDAFIEDALKNANLPAILMSMLHITGDREILRGPIRPGKAVFGGESDGLSDEDAARVRTRALEVLKAYRDSGCTLPPSPRLRRFAR